MKYFGIISGWNWTDKSAALLCQPLSRVVILSKKEQCRILKVLEDAGGRMARAERIFKSPIVLRGMPNYYGYLYTNEN